MRKCESSLRDVDTTAILVDYFSTLSIQYIGGIFYILVVAQDEKTYKQILYRAILGPGVDRMFFFQTILTHIWDFPLKCHILPTYTYIVDCEFYGRNI